MASDISITISADPAEALKNIGKVKDAGKDLSVSSKRLGEESAASASQSVNQVLSVGRAAKREFQDAGRSVNELGSGIRKAAGDAGKVAGAFGEAVPVVGRLGSAISAAITGPVGAISAAVGVAIAGIRKMLDETEARIQRLKMSASAQSSSAYDALMQGRGRYQQDLETLSQIKRINAVASREALSANELAQFRQLAAQLGIDERAVGARGIRSGEIAKAERTLKQQRRFYSDREYQDYLDATGAELRFAIRSSNLSDTQKRRLQNMSVQGMASSIASNARAGEGWTADEFKSWQDLYAIAKPLLEVRESYERDAMLGRSQSALNAASVDSILKAHSAAPTGSAAGTAEGAATPGTLAWAKQQRKLEQDQQSKVENLNRKLDEEIALQSLIVDGKQREAYLLRQKLSLESSIGRSLTAEEAADLERRAGLLYDLQNPAAPELAPDPGTDAASASPAVARSRARASWTLPLDRLQRIGANVSRPVTSPEKATMDKQLSVQEQIRNTLDEIARAAHAEKKAYMRF